MAKRSTQGLDLITRILIVEDEVRVARVLQNLLREMPGPSHMCFTAASGDEALAIVAEEIGLVISDIYMKGISGPDLARRMLTASPETVLVMMSGVDRIECATAAMRADAFDYIQKPLNPVRVEATVRRALDRRATARAAI
jgi:DNA-binding NtrC family response regulator